jgi:calcium-independent phospholipase A2
MRIEKQLGKDIRDYFDWFAGTSTGAILATALSQGYTTKQCLEFYLRLKDDVFTGSRPHETEPLESFLKKCFGEKKMSETIGSKRLMITTTKSDINPPKLVLIRNYQMPNTNTLTIPSNEISIWKAARCSSAAPTYFKSVDGIYMDGGLVANNPALDLLTDVHHFNMQRMNEVNPPENLNNKPRLG